MIISQVSYRTNGPLVLIFALKHRLWVLTIYVLSKNKKNIKFSAANFQFLKLIKSLCLLHGQVFIMKLV